MTQFMRDACVGNELLSLSIQNWIVDMIYVTIYQFSYLRW